METFTANTTRGTNVYEANYFAPNGEVGTFTCEIVASLAGGYVAEYFDNEDFTDPPVVKRFDTQTNNIYQSGDVGPSGEGNRASVEWVGVLYPPEPGSYEFKVWYDDCLTLVIGETTIKDDCACCSFKDGDSPAELLEGVPADFSAKFIERTGFAYNLIYWKTPSGNEFVPIPSEYIVSQNYVTGAPINVTVTADDLPSIPADSVFSQLRKVGNAPGGGDILEVEVTAKNGHDAVTNTDD